MTDSTYMKKFFIIFFVVLASVCEGQPSITWQRTYNGPQNFNDYSYGIAESTPGTYFILGQSGSGLYLLKINDYGDTIWTRATPRAASAIASSGDGGCVLASARYVTKFDQNGNMEWERQNTAIGSYPRDIKKTSDGGYVCCSDYLSGAQVFKTDSLGNLQWHKEFSSTSYLSFYSVVEAFNGGYIIGGTDFRQFGDTTRAVLYRLDVDGNVIWSKGYKILNRYTAGLILGHSNNKYIAAGSTYDSANASFDKLRIFFYELDTNGGIYSTKLFSDTGNYCEGLQDFKVINSNQYVFSLIIGNGSFCNLGIEAKIFKCDSFGSILNTNIFTTTSDIELKKILPLFNGDIIFPGVLETNLTTFEDIYVVRTDSNLKVKPMAILKNNASAIRTSFRLYQNYPNPFNPTTKIKFSVLQKSKITLTIYDMNGKEISTLLSEKNYNNGLYEVGWNAINFPSGIYFCVMKAGDFQQSKKLLLVK